MRGTATARLALSARRSAFEITFSKTEIGRRWRNAGAFVDALVFARQKRKLLDDLADELRDAHFNRRWRSARLPAR